MNARSPPSAPASTCLAEKQIGMDGKEAAQLEEAVAHADICLMSGYSFRYIAAWQKVRDFWNRARWARFGRHGRPWHPPLSTGWKASPETGGGPLLFSGTPGGPVLWFAGDGPVKVFVDIALAPTPADETTTSKFSSHGEQWRKVWSRRPTSVRVTTRHLWSPGTHRSTRHRFDLQG